MQDPLVLLPGMMCDFRLFLPQIKAFGQERAVMVAPISNGATILEIAQQALAAAPERFALCGLSMGGIVAMEMSRIAPDRITRIALLDTNPLSETPTVAAAREPQIIAAQSGRLAEVMREEMKPNYLAPGPRRNEVLQVVMDMAVDLGPEVFVRQSRALQKRADLQGALRRMAVPTLVACGEHDALCPVRRHEFMAELIPHAELRVIADAGHLPVLEQPEVTNEILRTWLSAPLLLR